MDQSRSKSDEQSVILFEDFNSRELDRNLWNVRVTGHTVNNEQQAYVDSSNTIYVLENQAVPDINSGGALIIHPRFHPNFQTAQGKKFDFISGRMDTRDKFDFQFGTAEARMRLPTGSGCWPAFWALGNGSWPVNGEIDIMESIGDPSWTSAGVHGPGYSGEAGLINHHYFPEFTDSTTWHTYGVDWSPEELVFKLDGKVVFRVTSAMVKFHGEWVFNNPKHLILNFALGGKYPYKINAVDSPYYGLPSSTVEVIKNDQAKLMIDWVKVTGNFQSGGA